MRLEFMVNAPLLQSLPPLMPPVRSQLFCVHLDELEYIRWKIETKILKFRSSGMYNIMFKSVSLYLCVFIPLPWITSKISRERKIEWAEPFQMEMWRICVCLQTTRRPAKRKVIRQQEKYCGCYFSFFVGTVLLDSDTNWSTVKEDEEPIWCMVHFDLHSFALSVFFFIT